MEAFFFLVMLAGYSTTTRTGPVGVKLTNQKFTRDRSHNRLWFLLENKG